MADFPRHLFPAASTALATIFSALPEAAAQSLPVAGEALDARLLFTVGSTLGVMAFAIGTAIVCLRATRRARQQSAAAAAEVEKLRNRKNRLEAILAAEPQILYAWADSPKPKLLISNLPPYLGVPDSPSDFLRLERWLDMQSVDAVQDALEALMARGEAFNITLRTLQDRYVEMDGRAAGSSLTLKVRDIAGQRLDLARRAEQYQGLERQISALKSLLDLLPSPAWLRDGSGRLVWVNEAYAEATEATNPQEAVEGQIELLNSATRGAVASALASGAVFRREIEIPTSQGLKRYEAAAVAAEGLTAGVTAEALSNLPAGGEAALRLRGFDHMATAFAMFDAQQRLIHFNRAYARLWGLAADWLETGPSDGEILDRLRLGRRLPEKADYQRWKREWLGLYGRDTQFTDEWHLPDGRTLNVVVDSAPDGGATYLFEDVTERLALESRYNALIQVQRETLDTLREGVAVYSPDGALRLCNRAFATIWRLSSRQLEGEPHIDQIIGWCRPLYDVPEEWERMKAAVTAIVAERHAYESQFERPDGSVIACAALPLPDGGTLITYVDVSDSVRAQQALEEKNKVLEEADQIKTAFIGHVSYEMRTPLTSIIGFTDMLSEPRTGPLTEKQREYLADIGASGQTLLAIIDDILDLASIEAGALKLNLSEVRVREVIASLKTGLRDKLVQKEIRLETEVASDVDGFAGDEQRISQILYNLLSNAIGFSPAGATVTLSCRKESDMLAFTVADRGIGIPEDYQAEIFKPFESRTDGSGHRGAGLGLTIVKSLVELHGGHIELKSIPDDGTEITVWLPLVQGDALGEDDASERAAGQVRARSAG